MIQRDCPVCGCSSWFDKGETSCMICAKYATAEISKEEIEKAKQSPHAFLKAMNDGFDRILDTPINDPINPNHYKSHKSGIECIEITRHMSFNLGNAIKYLWRADLKNGIEDLKKAVWYINDEINKREKQNEKPIDSNSDSSVT